MARWRKRWKILLTSTPLVGVWVSTSLGAHQKPSVCEAPFLEVFGVVVFVPEHETRLLGQDLDQERGDTAVVDVGRSKASSQRYPHAGHGACQVQLPAKDPPVPA